MKNILKNYINEFVNEMPMTKLQKVGNFNKSGAFDKTDIKLLNNEKALKKITKQWEKTQYDFETYLINIPELNKSIYRERGEIEQNSEFILHLKEKFNINLDINSDKITILFNGNSGDEKVPLTGWMMAHRFGHAIRTSKSIDYLWKIYIKETEQIFNNLLNSVYDIDIEDMTFSGVSYKKINDIKKYLYMSLGTMKSAKDGNIIRPYEFYYELFAQYLLTGKISFNPVPLQLLIKKLPFGKKQHKEADKEISEIWTRDLVHYAERIEYNIETILGACLNKIFLM